MATDRSRAPRRRLTGYDYLRIAFSIAAVVLIVFGLFLMREASRSRGWAWTDGRVVQSSVNQFTAKGTTTFRPIVVYAYSVGPVRYMSSRIAFRSLASGDRAEPAKMVASYPEGRAVRGFYDPQEPDQAVLEPAANPWTFIVAGGACSMLAVLMRILRARADKSHA